MADTGKRKAKAAPQGTRAPARQVAKAKVIESGEDQGEAIEAGSQAGHRVSDRDRAREQEREDYRSGGIPTGSDPRE